jgi:V8-like Glu-specific endopeptidase
MKWLPVLLLGALTSSQLLCQSTQPPPEDRTHAEQDLKAATKVLNDRPKAERAEAAKTIAADIVADPRASPDIKDTATRAPEQLLRLKPDRLPLDDILAAMQSVQSVLDPSLLLSAVLPNGLKIVPNPNFPKAINDPSVKAVMTHAAELAQKSRSVGRIEVVDSRSSTPRLVGTAVVVGKTYMMTACHVAAEIASLDATAGVWRLNSITYADFGNDSSHSASKEFELSGVACMSNKTGFDIAILAVSPTSRDTTATLPPALPLASKETAKQVKIAVIGYPAVNYPEGTEKTRELMKLLDDEAPDQSKFVAPGQVMSDEQKGDFHVLTHIAATHAGNSGSPVFSLDPVEVIGIHYCCTGLSSQSESPTAGSSQDCSSTSSVDIHSNEAISAVDATKLIPKGP